MHEHECFNKFDEALKPVNGRLAFAFTISRDQLDLGMRLMVATEKLDPSKRKKIPAVMASYCPFCGASLIGSASKE